MTKNISHAFVNLMLTRYRDDIESRKGIEDLKLQIETFALESETNREKTRYENSHKAELGNGRIYTCTPNSHA